MKKERTERTGTGRRIQGVWKRAAALLLAGIFLLTRSSAAVFADPLDEIPEEAHVTAYMGFDYSLVYDYDYYAAHNPDAAAEAGTDDAAMLKHFVTIGIPEGRKGNAVFDVLSYQREYPDLRKAYGQNLLKYYQHYVRYGHKEGRHTSGCTVLKNPITVWNGFDYAKVYNFDYYIGKYPDLKAVFDGDDVGAIRHFVTYGMKEQRQAISTFDVKSYRRAYPDLRLAFGNNYPKYYEHFVKYGYKENRALLTGILSILKPVTTKNSTDYSPIFDFGFYTNKYTDVKTSFWDDDIGALNHFSTTGLQEGRQGKEIFDQAVYDLMRENVTIKDKTMLQKAQGYKSDTSWLILVNRATRKTGIYQRSGSVWKEYAVWTCSVGKPSTPTVAGVWKVITPYRTGFYDGDTNSYVKWGTRFGTKYGQKPNGYLFHSVLYKDQNCTIISDGRLGEAVSHGCVRLEISKAKWIYDNIPLKTTVVVY